MSFKPDHTDKQVVLQVSGLDKSFGSVSVLNDIDLTVSAGETHAILGENGAGKSTLVKILAGFETPSAGEMRLYDGAGASRLLGGWDHETAEAAGVVLIHQELNLAEQLSVAENLFLGNEIRRGWLLDKRAMAARSREYLEALDCQIDPATRVAELAISARQMVEIAKACGKQSRLLILDEPTAVLTRQESTVLFELIARLKADGVAIVYISHKLEEIEQLADRISILRDGSLVGHFRRGELSTDDMARHMVGRELSNLFPAINPPPAGSPVVLEVARLPFPGSSAPASFNLCRGEILGFAGLVGSGRTALMETLVGLRAVPGRRPAAVRLHGKPVNFHSLAAARDSGIAYLTKDRKGSGLLLNMGLPVNFSLFALKKYSRGLIDGGREWADFQVAVRTFDIRIPDARVDAGNLSGGNQQKLLLAKILAADPEVLIIDEPTRGIDVGTRSQIYHFIAGLVKAGKSIILVSSDMTEIIGLCQRVAVMYHGAITGILSGDEIEEHAIMRFATGLKRQELDNERDCA